MEKHFEKYFSKHPVQNVSTGSMSDITVVIPVFLEEEHLFKTLLSLKKASEAANIMVELVLVFNYAANAGQHIKNRQHKLAQELKLKRTELEHAQLRLTILKVVDIEPKHAGVGYARKAGMDYAARTFAVNKNEEGIIASLDADTLVETNYFTAIQNAFKEKQLNACTIGFEHPLEGAYNNEIYNAIAEYELHLRYYLQALRYAGFPFAYHTIGSCFAVTANTYVRAGGMPRKQAGEDFYFLQKVIPQGQFAEIHTTTVRPSSRPSDRVPFGTGPSINKIVETGEEYMSYNLQAFIDLKAFFAIKEQLYKIKDSELEDHLHNLSGRMRSYLLNSDFFKALKPINDNCKSLSVFNKRFYEVFNAFRVVKYLNYTHTHFIEKTPVFDAAMHLLLLRNGEEPDVLDTKELLIYYRNMEKE